MKDLLEKINGSTTAKVGNARASREMDGGLHIMINVYTTSLNTGM